MLPDNNNNIFYAIERYEIGREVPSTTVLHIVKYYETVRHNV